MRVTCPNCDRSGLIDIASLSDLPARALCPRCGTPFLASPSGFESANAAHAVAGSRATPAAFSMPRAIARHAAPAAQTHHEISLRAATRDDSGDGFSLPRVPAPKIDLYVIPEPADDLLARAPRTRTRAAADNYQLAVRLMNVSPLWMLAACAGFFVLVFAFDLMLSTATRANGDAPALASAANNQATNRAASRRARAADPDQSEEPAANEVKRDADEAPTGYDQGAPSPGADTPADRGESKPAPVSDAQSVATGQPLTRDAEVSFANASAEVRAEPGVEARPSGLTLQLGSFRVAGEARKQADALRAAGFDARVAEQQSWKRPWYCVQTGSFATREDAERHLAGLRAKGFASRYSVIELR